MGLPVIHRVKAALTVDYTRTNHMAAGESNILPPSSSLLCVSQRSGDRCVYQSSGEGKKGNKEESRCLQLRTRLRGGVDGGGAC